MVYSFALCVSEDWLSDCCEGEVPRGCARGALAEHQGGPVGRREMQQSVSSYSYLYGCGNIFGKKLLVLFVAKICIFFSSNKDCFADIKSWACCSFFSVYTNDALFVCLLNFGVKE